MANTDIGKKWENKFKSTWEKQFPDTLIYRLPDQQSGYAGSGGSNPCDFMCYPGTCVLMVECKAHKGASIPFNDITQYERQLDYKKCYKTFPGVLVWFYEKDTIIWVSIEEMEKMVSDGEKSIGLRMIDEKKPYKKAYNIKVIPAQKLRTFMEADLNYLVEHLEE
jgi:Holliday junction resolvase